jgi:hypothetical protein
MAREESGNDGLEVDHQRTEAMTDQMGNFTLRGYSDAKYRVFLFDNSFRAFQEGRTGDFTDADDVVLKEEVSQIEIVIPLCDKS